MGTTENIHGRITAIFVAPEKVGVAVTTEDDGELREMALFPLDHILLPQSEGLRRAALLKLAERAYADSHNVHIVLDVATQTVTHLRIVSLYLEPSLIVGVQKIEHPFVPFDPLVKQQVDG